MDQPDRIMPPEVLAQDAAARLLQITSTLVSEMHPGREHRVRINSHLERDLGLDSLARVELLLRIQGEFGTSLPDKALLDAETPGDLLRYVAQTNLEGTREGSVSTPQPLTQGAACDIPEQAETLVEVLEWHATHNSQRTHVLLYGEDEQARPITYVDLLRAARRMANGLVARGLSPGQTVALMLPTSRAYLACFFGVMLAGGIPVPIYPPARMAQLEDHLKRHARILANAQIVFLVTVAQAKGVAALLRQQAPSLTDILTPDEIDKPAVTPHHRCLSGDIAFLQYTSGSTGDPKGVVLTHANLLANLRSIGGVTGITSEDVFVSWLPLYHDMGLIGAWFGSLYFAMPLVLMSPVAFLTRPSRWLAAISRHRGTVSAAPNFAYELCARKISDAELQGLDLSHWRLAMNGAEPVSPKTLEDFANRFVPHGLKRETLFPVYGLAECSVGLSFPPLGRVPLIDSVRRKSFTAERYAAPSAGEKDPILVPSCGRVLPQHEIRIVDDTGEELQERWIGHLQFRGPSATAGYYRNPEATRGLFCDGWLDSGDYAYSAAGEIYLTGRVKDLIIRGGRNIYPYELEQAIGNIPGVRKGCVAAFASSDPVNATERLVVVAETREEEASRREALRQKINDATVDIIGMPADEIVLAPPNSVLKTSSGKIRRSASRSAYELGTLNARAAPAWQQWLQLGSALLRSRLVQGLRRTRKALYAGWCWLVFGLVVSPVALVVTLLQKPASGGPLMHRATRLFMALIGMSVHAIGLKRIGKSTHLLLVNHCSYLDSLALYAALPPAIGYAFVAKRELASSPFMRALLNGLGTLSVERFSAARSTEGVEAIVSAVNLGRNLIIFPEATFTRETGLRDFHMGAFVAAARTGVPVVIAGLRGTRSALRDGRWMPRKTRLEIEIGPLLQAQGNDWNAAINLRDRARTEMLKLCGEHDLVR